MLMDFALIPPNDLNSLSNPSRSTLWILFNSQKQKSLIINHYLNVFFYIYCERLTTNLSSRLTLSPSLSIAFPIKLSPVC